MLLSLILCSVSECDCSAFLLYIYKYIGGFIIQCRIYHCANVYLSTGPSWPGRKGGHLPDKNQFLPWIFAYVMQF